eukprot:UN01727
MLFDHLVIVIALKLASVAQKCFVFFVEKSYWPSIRCVLSLKRQKL